MNLYRYVGNTPTVFTEPSGLDEFWLFDGKVKGPLYLLPGGKNVWSDAWSLVFPKRSREYLQSPLHQNFHPDQTSRPGGLKAGDIIDRDTRDGHKQAVQGIKSTLAEAGLQAGMAVIPGNPFRGPNAPRQAYKHLQKYHGVDPTVASNRLHKIKQRAGSGATDDVVIGRTDDVSNDRTGGRLGSLTDNMLGK